MSTRLCLSLVSALLLAVAPAHGENERGASAPGSPLLPDLIVWASKAEGYLYGWTIDTTQIPGRTLLRLTTAIPNIGAGPMELRGGRTYADDTQDVFQRIHDSAGGFTDTLAGTFFFHEQHGHIHFEEFMQFNLRQVTSGGGIGAIVAGGDKVSFCLLDVQDYPAAPGPPQYFSCGQIQGISVGWADVYNQSVPDQWIDITGVPAGTYWLEVVADPEDRLLESDETNNTNLIMITVGDGEPQLVADINSSGRVDGFDLAVLARAFGSNLGEQNFDPAADLVPDETIDGMDLALFMQFFGFDLY